MSILSFDQIVALKIGDTIYECERGLNLRAKVKSLPEVYTGAGTQRRSVTFFADGPHGIISYRVTEGLMHYGPRLYDEPEYARIIDGKPVFEFVGEP